jgi:tripartite-type tricarboxylate transporter receptor subunit TctC
MSTRGEQGKGTMQIQRRRFLSLAAGTAALPVTLNVTLADAYPSRPITIIVPFAAGGATDVLARILAERMRASLGQPLLVEDVTGAAGSIGVTRAVRSPPDGYTLSVGTLTTHVLIGALYQLPYNLLTDLSPIAEIGSEPPLICIRNSLSAKNLQEFIAWLKENPDKANAGIPGVGSTGNLAGLAFQKATGTKFQFISYRGDGPAVQDLVAGNIDLMIEPSSNSVAQVQAGTIRALAVPAKMRHPGLPDVPTTDEAGLPGFYASIWFGIWAPKDPPPDILAKLNAATVEALADADVRTKLGKLGQQVAPRDQQTPEALAAYQKAEAEKWWPIIKAANIKGE